MIVRFFQEALYHPVTDALSFRCNIEIGPKFKDWRDVTTIRRRARANELRRKFNSWRKLFLPSRYKILCAIFSNLAPLMRYRFLIWKERTRWQRAIEFHDRKTKRRVVDALRAYARFSRRSRLAQKFLRWKQMLIFVRRLKKIVSLCDILCQAECLTVHIQTIFDSLSIKRAFAKWRLLPATPMQVAGPPPRDCSLLMRVLQRWALNKTRRFFQRWRLRPDAPDDDYNCVCMYVILMFSLHIYY